MSLDREDGRPTTDDGAPTANAFSTDNNKEQVSVPGAKSPRKLKRKKRFLWQDDLHQRFVAAIFDLGLKNASPKALLPLMKTSSPDSELTTEHLKSHLQKYRINYQRAQKEFQELYDRQARRSWKRQRRLGHRSMSSPALVFPVPQAKRHKSVNVTDSDTDSEDENSSYMDNTTKRDGSRHRSSGYSHELADAVAAAASYGYPVGYLPTPQSSADVIDPQWSTFNMLMSTPAPDAGPLSIQVPNEVPSLVQAQAQENLQIQMHQAMQAQMNFHRQMLTRKVELSHQVFQRSPMESLGGNVYADYQRDYNFNAQNANPGSFEQVWASTPNLQQQQLDSRQLQQQQMNNYSNLHLPSQHLPPTKPQAESIVLQPPTSDALPLLIATPEVESAASVDDEVNGDLGRWDRFSLNVDLESDDLFDFLKA